MNAAISRLFSAAEKDAPGDDEYLGIAVNSALVILGVRRGARLDLGIKRDGHLWRALATTRGYRLVAWDERQRETAWPEPLFLKAKHAREAAGLTSDDFELANFRLMARLLGYPECRGSRVAMATLLFRLQRGLGDRSSPVYLAGVKCSKTKVKKAGLLLQSWADAGNREMAGEAYSCGGQTIRVHFVARIDVWTSKGKLKVTSD
jgi:hypothetical protein